MTYLPPANGGRINMTIGGNTAGVGSLVSTGTATLVGGNNITLSQNGNVITISGGAGGGAGSNSFGMSNLGNTSGTTGMVSGSAIQFAFAGGNNVTLSQSINASSGTITISAASQTVQTQNLHNVTLGGNVAGVMAQVSSGTLTLVGGNNVTLSQNGNAVTISGASQVAQTNQTLGLYALGNVTQNTSATFDARTLSFNALGAATMGYSNGSIQVSVPTQTAQTQSNIQAFYDGVNSISTGTVRFSNSNGVSFGINGQTITASVAPGGGGGVAISAGGGLFSTGTLGVNATGALTISSGAQSLTLSVPQVSSLSATGAVSISTNGATISIGAPVVQAPVTLSRFEYPEGLFTSLGAIGQGSLSINHMYVPFNVTGTAMKIGGSLSVSTATSASTASQNMSLWMGIYSLNGSTLSLASSGSANNSFAWSHSASTTANTSVQSMRQMTVPMNVNMTPGEYWVAAVVSTATTFASAGYTMYGNNQVANAAANAILTPIGSNTTAARDVMLFQGIYTANTSAGPTTIVGSQINNTGASVVQRANFYNVIFNATY